MRQRKTQKPTAEPPAAEYTGHEHKETPKSSFTFYAFCSCVIFLALVAMWKRTSLISSCQVGRCELQPGQVQSREFGPYVPEKLVFIRIPKTGSSSLLKQMKPLLKSKGIRPVSFPEWTDAVPKLNTEKLRELNKQESIESGTFHKSVFSLAESFQFFSNFFPSKPSPGYTSSDSEGYDPATRFRFHQNIARKAISATQRTVFFGHVFHLDWMSVNDMFPKKKLTQQEMDIEQMTFLRHPIMRLHSQYNYDRSEARGKIWRDNFIRLNGNLTFEECILTDSCIEANELERWGNLQTEVLCGLDTTKCKRPLTEESYNHAKANLDTLLFVGILDEATTSQPLLKKSIQILQTLLPLHFDLLTHSALPHLKKGASTIDPNSVSMEKLTALCKYDIALYDYAVSKLSDKIQ